MSDNTNVVYRIRLQPVDKFFFGGEKSVSKNSQTFYFQTSRNFPQQTTVVGMLRKTLLEEAGLLIRETTGRRVKKGLTPEQVAVAGKSSFSVDGSDFGELTNVSPVMILDNANNFLHCAKKCNNEENSLSSASFQTIGNVKVSTVGTAVRQSFQFLPKLDPKTDFVNGFESIDTKHFLTTDKVFADSVTQVGINKPTKKRREIEQTEEAGFFKQTYQRLQKGFAFGCYATFKTAVFGDAAERWVQLGGERSLFKMTLTRESNLPDFLTQSIADQPMLLCLSDAYLPQSVLKNASGVFSPITFKHFITNVEQENYAKLPTQSDKFNLVEKGSILIFEEIPEIYDLQNSHFHKIGYNYFINL
jgi:CRISPR-associated protein Cmr3